MPINRTVRYVAKQGYQLMMMTGHDNGTIAGCSYRVFASDGHVYVVQDGVGRFVPIAKSWINL